MSGTSAFIRWNCGAKFGVKLQFPHHPKLESAILRAWYEDKTKFCRLESLLWQTVFCLFPFWANNLVRGILFNFRLWKILVSKYLSTQTLVVVHESSNEDKLFHVKEKRGLLTFMSSWPFWDARMSFFACKWFFWEWAIKCCFEVCHVTSFYALQDSFEKVYYAIAEEPDKLFWTGLKGRLLHLWENVWNTWRVEKFCVFIVQKFSFFSLSGIKTFEGTYLVFVQWRIRSSVWGNKSINKWL